MKNHFLILSVLVGALIACNEKPDISPTVSYGYSFGYCIGYCITEARIVDHVVTVTRAGHREEEVLKNSSRISAVEIQAILDGVDAEAFSELPEVIGCPDCADGGAEWLELTMDGKQKRVTFEYGQDIEGIAEAVDKLRTLTGELKPEED